MDENSDFSKAIDQLQQMLSSDDGQSQIQNLLGMLTSGDESDSTPSTPSSLGANGLDIDTIMKISGVMQAMNDTRDNPKTAFLNALRPFLRESRRDKLDKAAKIIKLVSVLKAFKETYEGGV